jgi:tetratricopeptide (TPR) repeat protein
MKRFFLVSIILTCCFTIPGIFFPGIVIPGSSKPAGSHDESLWLEHLRTAQASEKSGKLSESISQYRKLLREYPALETSCRYFIARNFERMAVPANAVREYGKILSKNRRRINISFDDRAFVLASLERLYHMGMDVEAAEKALKCAARTNGAARFYLFSLSLRKGDYEAAAEMAQDMLIQAEEEPIVSHILQEILEDRRAIEYLKDMNTTVYQLFTRSLARGLYDEALAFSYLLPDDDEMIEKRAFAFFTLRDYHAAVSLFREHHERTGSPESLLWIAFSQYHLGQYLESEVSLDRYRAAVRDRVSVRNLDEDAAYLDLLLALERSSGGDSLQRVYEYMTRYQGHRPIDPQVTGAFYQAFTSGERGESLRFLQEVSPYLSRSYYRSWASYMLGLYIDPSHLRDAVLFQPDSYHGLRARDLLPYEDFEDDERVGPGIRHVVDVLEQSLIGRMICIGFVDPLEEILTAGLWLSPLQDRLVYQMLLARVHYAKGEYSEGIEYAENILESIDSQSLFSLPHELLSLLYPEAYEAEIGSLFSRKDRDYDCHLVRAIMREESRYDDRARSSRGALGLMQLMPGTASWVLKRELSAQELYDPATNLDASLSYLDYLFDRFGTLEYAVASYNGGPTVVARWVRNKPDLSVEKFVEEIPYPETRNFVKKVYTSYQMYNHLYGKPLCSQD